MSPSHLRSQSPLYCRYTNPVCQSDAEVSRLPALFRAHPPDFHRCSSFRRFTLYFGNRDVKTWARISTSHGLAYTRGTRLALEGLSVCRRDGLCRFNPRAIPSVLVRLALTLPLASTDAVSARRTFLLLRRLRRGTFSESIAHATPSSTVPLIAAWLYSATTFYFQYTTLSKGIFQS